jgi:AcrR family transcriptional regulator
MGSIVGSDMADPKPSTRGRILDVCRVLFNERGPAEVTTAEIAQVVGISEGNLHYHFHRKEQIVAALFDQFEAAIDRAGMPSADLANQPEPHRRYLAGWFNMMWEWRLFYAAGIYRLAPSLQPRLMHVTDHGQVHIRRVLHSLVRDGLLVANEAEIDRLVVNAWIVASYWIDYLRSRQGVQTVTRDHLRWGYAQVEALFTPYAASLVTEESAAFLKKRSQKLLDIGP